ncbi:hypothetical protein PHYBLDRAFT_187578 [Phycomyces blakesleeanus NRRL 1555(-)]|uniref:G-protein coupled receptors family 3 profile domain-containing protein n=1 Tax=Phycomyces blakesleeanus (strain ATCC 8743b / DSM 1359 / FGSC 10004 / NBRC 33097 / NRRL 1555) TaxID=763407 RepID=A0A163DIQ1_PHYB8|nr:hypothetical protein PHYBLDRAFT_187578 [Phycomyces blakesleeanus NRRL 1555(-)]OAD71510.1 hypothetical protein PHYBLDRAFT_187578 [Phycomyces blakesleeanus NRRL 1555(-)]|eukprot:XP_018289550.1 hypothetical protein PHYBLDRAFT_187578 [Phycomyces blakesleeanus NRRL 1555(-)]
MNISTSNATMAFGRMLADDGITTLTQVDSNTVVITPRFNTANKTELKIGVLLPFSQTDDNFTAQIVWGGMSAIRMAVNDINEQGLIPGAYITLIERDSFPQDSAEQTAVTDAVYASVTLLQQGVIGVIGDISSSWTSLSAIMTSTLEIPQCSFTASAISFSDKTQYKYFFRTIPTQVIIADVMLSFAAAQNWTKIGVLYTDDPLGQQFYQRAVVQAGITHLQITQFHAIPLTGTETIRSDLTSMTSAGTRIMIVAASGDPLANLMITAADMGLMSSEYAWLLMGEVSDSLSDSIQAHNANHNTTRAIDYNQTFSGLFMFDNWLTLYGYPPFESFLDLWSALDPSAYPFAGQRKITTNEGLAYSCMMVMAQGFSHTVNTISNQSYALEQLASGELGQYLLPSAFNVGYVGPEGPMVYDSNGDLTNGNYRIYNLQHGNQAVIGQSVGGVLTLTSSPIYHDGTSKANFHSPAITALNPDMSSPVAHAILAVAATGIFFALIVFGLVVTFRKHEVFKASSPLFCCFELVGFVLTYLSVTFMIGTPTQTSCIAGPLVFNFGFLLVLGNMIAKNYRIYRIFNNIFISRTVITDLQLIKTVSVVVGIDMIILCIGLIVSKPTPTMVAVSVSVYYWECQAQSDYKIVFSCLMGIYVMFLLVFATYLAYKTRLAGRQYSHYNECRQMGLSVYNILFSALVGFAVGLNQMADFFTKYYITVITILWATTFSLLILFVPKLQAFYKQRTVEKQAANNEAKEVEQRNILQSVFNSTSVQPTDGFSGFSNTGGIGGGGGNIYGGNGNGNVGELISLDQLLASDNSGLLDPAQAEQRKASIVSAYLELSNSGGDSNCVEVHEWEMKHIMVFPWLGYFSYFSQETRKGTVLAYAQAAIHSAQLNDYVIKVKGQGLYDMYIQVPDLKAVETWQRCFNQKSNPQTYIQTGQPSFNINSDLNSSSRPNNNHHNDLHSRPGGLLSDEDDSDTLEAQKSVVPAKDGHAPPPSHSPRRQSSERTVQGSLGQSSSRRLSTTATLT